MPNPIPQRTPVLDEKGLMVKPWVDYLRGLGVDVELPRRLIAGALLGTAAAIYYTAPPTARARIDKLTFTNTSLASAIVTVYLVPSGAAVGDAYKLAAQSIDAGDTWECTPAAGQVLEAAGTIQAYADVDGVIAVIGSGILVSV